jgi:integrase
LLQEHALGRFRGIPRVYCAWLGDKYRADGFALGLDASCNGTYWLLAKILYGSGLRLGELVRLRVKDLDFDAGLVVVRSGKGDKDRTTLLPASLHGELRTHLEKVRQWHEADLANGHGEAPLPAALARKYPNAGRPWGWQYVFPADKLAVDPADGKVRRYHVHEKAIQAAVKRARQAAGITKHATPHTLRHYAESRIMPSVLPLYCTFRLQHPAQTA